jgi:GIY-YIG catalytic domain/NUMOD3 motif
MIKLVVYGTPAPRGDGKWTIYALGTQLQGIRYVGVTTWLKRRLRDHVYRATHGADAHKDRWLRAAAESEDIVCTILEIGCGDVWKERETYWISHYRALGLDLTNATSGGDGCRGFKHSEETKLGQSIRVKGKKLTETHRLAISRSCKGLRLTPEQIARRRGKRHTAEALARMSAAQRGHPVSTETRLKISAKKRGVPIPVRARPKPFTPEHRAAISAALRLAYATGKRGRKSWSA